ncbi:MAG: hypothetical protein WD426_18485 [Anditalea sp.]
MHNKKIKHSLLWVFYLTSVFFVVSLLFSRFIREPYPSVNMPTFSKSGINNGVVPAISLEGVYYRGGEQIWKGNLREIFGDVPEGIYINNMRFIFFNERGKSSKEGNMLRKKLFSILPGGEKLFVLLNQWVKNQVVGDAEHEIAELLCRRKPTDIVDADAFEVLEYTEYYDLIEGLIERDLVRSKKLQFPLGCNH